MPTNVSGVSTTSDLGLGAGAGYGVGGDIDWGGGDGGDVLSDAVNEAVSEVGDFGAGAGVSVDVSLDDGSDEGGFSASASSGAGASSSISTSIDTVDYGGASGKGDFAGDFSLDSGFYDFGDSNVVNDVGGTVAGVVGGTGGVTNRGIDMVDSDPWSPVTGGAGFGLPGSISIDGGDIARGMLGIDAVGLGTPVDALNGIGMSADMFRSPADMLAAAQVAGEIGTHLRAIEGNLQKDQDRIATEKIQDRLGPAPMEYTPAPGKMQDRLGPAPMEYTPLPGAIGLPYSSISQSPFAPHEVNMTEAQMRDRLTNYLNTVPEPGSMSERLGLKRGEFEKPNFMGQSFPPENITDIQKTPAVNEQAQPQRNLPQPVSMDDLIPGPPGGGKYQDRITPEETKPAGWTANATIGIGATPGGSAATSVTFGVPKESVDLTKPSTEPDVNPSDIDRMMISQAAKEMGPVKPSIFHDVWGDGSPSPKRRRRPAPIVADSGPPEFITPVYEYPPFYGIYGYRFLPGSIGHIPGTGVYDWMGGLA